MRLVGGEKSLAMIILVKLRPSKTRK